MLRLMDDGEDTCSTMLFFLAMILGVIAMEYKSGRQRSREFSSCLSV